MITVNNIRKSYGETIAVDIESLSVPAGETFGLVGNNGAGKTTFYRLLLDLIKPDSGNIFLKEENVQKSERWKKFTSSYLDEDFLIGYLTPEEYFNFISKVYGRNKPETDKMIEWVKDFFNDEILGNRKLIRDLSKGNKQKVGIAAALLASPEILVLDEPFANLDPTSQFRLKKLLNNIREEKKITILISSHDLNHVSDVCERIVILEKGKIIQDFMTDSQTISKLEAYFAV
jgi:ABC-2 type transport system ATP-binding protein